MKSFLDGTAPITSILQFTIAVVLSFGLLGQLHAAERPAKPNILIMMADDMGIGDTSVYLGVSLGPGAPPIQRDVVDTESGTVCALEHSFYRRLRTRFDV